MASPRRIVLSIRDFAVPSPRRGHIEVNSGMGGRSEVSAKLHEQIQARRAYDIPGYETEFWLTQDVERDGFRFVMSGRADGFIRGNPNTIEEIKCSFAFEDLWDKVSNDSEHPFVLQLRTYGYFYFLQTQSVPSLRLLLGSPKEQEIRTLEIDLNLPDYEKWKERRVDELVEEYKRRTEQVAKRKKLFKQMQFPFPTPRPHQRELIQFVEASALEGKRVLIQAPTGLGKTLGVVYPLAREAFHRGEKLVYTTPKNSQHRLAEEAVDRLNDGLEKKDELISRLTLNAKSKVCLKSQVRCQPDYCEYAKDYYTKVADKKLVEASRHISRLSPDYFREQGLLHEVCPFELSLDTVPEADVVIGDYNYVFSPRSLLGRLASPTLASTQKPNLIVDEAHNLPGRARDYFSAELTTDTLDEAERWSSEFDGRLQDDWQIGVRSLRKTLASVITEDSRGSWQAIPVEELRTAASVISATFNAALAGSAPEDLVSRAMGFDDQVRGFVDLIANPRTEIKPFFERAGFNVRWKILCCDASLEIRVGMAEFKNTVGFSATMKPLPAFERLMGIESATGASREFDSPFDPSRRKILLIPQVSTKSASRHREAPRIAEIITRVCELKLGHYLICFPSFEFANNVSQLIRSDVFKVWVQRRDTKNIDIDALMDSLRGVSQPTLIFAVQGGQLAEGLDYTDVHLKGVVVVGPGLPAFDYENELLRQHFDLTDKAGFQFAYVIPAMTRVIQSAGRLIRNPEDRGLIVLIDNRFLDPQYAAMMPHGWYDQSAHELVPTRLLQQVEDFWRNTNNIERHFENENEAPLS